MSLPSQPSTIASKTLQVPSELDSSPDLRPQVIKEKEANTPLRYLLLQIGPPIPAGGAIESLLPVLLSSTMVVVSQVPKWRVQILASGSATQFFLYSLCS